MLALSFEGFLQRRGDKLHFEPLSDFVEYGLHAQDVVPLEFAQGEDLKHIWDIGYWYIIDAVKEKVEGCKWYAPETEVCCNGDCPLVADFVCEDRECLVCKYKEVESTEND